MGYIHEVVEKEFLLDGGNQRPPPPPPFIPVTMQQKTNIHVVLVYFKSGSVVGEIIMILL